MNSINFATICANNCNVYSVAFLRHSNTCLLIVSHLKRGWRLLGSARLLGTIRYIILSTPDVTSGWKIAPE